MKFKIGDAVETIDDDISGIITKISENTITVEDSDGFDLQFDAKELMICASGNSFANAVYDTDIEAVKREKETRKEKTLQRLNQKNDMHQSLKLIYIFII